jgi:hypothetical protein
MWFKLIILIILIVMMLLLTQYNIQSKDDAESVQSFGSNQSNDTNVSFSSA